jgi:uracil-DNA glycosylase family 4
MEEGKLLKIIDQHQEMENFFSGGLIVKSAAGGPQQQTAEAISPDIADGLKQIADEVCKCRKCELGSLRRNAVPGEGSPTAQIAFVGEGPGADEDAQGRPFVGRAGQLLDKIIKGMGLKREDVYICNVIKCRPPENRDPKPEEIISCLPYLQRQLELINPKIIVALGAHAARSLLNNNKAIGQLRGQFHEYYPGLGGHPIKLMATFHPAYLLRNYSDDNRAKVWEDMKKVLAELNLPIPDHRKK